MIIPLQKNQQVVNEINAFHSSDGNSFKIWWLAQSGFLIKYGDVKILFDPYLSDSLSIKYEHTDKPHVRVSEIVIQPELLTGIHIVTSSHNHTDHLDADTLQPILKNNPEVSFIIPEANRAFIADRVKCDLDFPIGLNDNAYVTIRGVEVIGIPAAHNNIDRDETGNLKYMGFICKFGPFALYHSGDTLWYEGLDDILKMHNLDLALLPINGNKPERRVAGNLSATEAAELAKTIGSKWVIPHHYDLFAFNTENPAVFVEACENVGVNYKVMQLGEGFEIRKV